MDLLDYLAIWGRRWKIILLTTMLGVAVAAGISAFTQPKYVATTQMFVTATGGASVVEAYQGNLFGQERVTSYVQLAQSKQIAQRTVDQLAINLTPEELQSMIVSTALPNSVLMSISVENANPELARDLADAVALQMSQLVEELETSARGGSPSAAATIVDEADLPTTADTPKWIPNLLYGLVGGLLIGLTVSIARDKLDRAVRSADGAALASGAPPMGTVPDAFATGSTGLPFGASDPRSSEAFRSLRTAVLATRDSHSTGAIILAGPTGETASVTLSLAAALAETGKPVIAVDSNLRDKQISYRLDLGDRLGLSDVLQNAASLDTTVFHSEKRGLDILPAGSVPESPSELLASPEMIKVLTSLCDKYDFVLVSGSPLLEYSDSLIMSEWTDGVLLVARLGQTTDKQLAASASYAKMARTQLIGVVATDVKRRRLRAKASVAPAGVGS